MMMMEDSQLDKSIELQKKELESKKNEHPDKETLLQLEELQRKGDGLGIKFPYLKEMIETLQGKIKPPTSQSLAASNSASEEALYGCLRNIMVLVAKRAANYNNTFTFFMSLVYDYLQSRVFQMDRYQDLLLSNRTGLLYEKENVLNKRQTLQDERLNELIEKYYPLRVLIGEKKSEKPSTAVANSNPEIQDTENEEVGDEISDKTQHSENEWEGEENATSLGIENEEEEDNEEVGDKISNKTQHSENEGEGEENATSLGIENEEEEDNEEVGDKISNKTQHSENEGEGEENATSLFVFWAQGIENEEEEDNEEVGDKISNKTQHSENEGEGEENATSLGIENEEEEDNEEVGDKISNKTQHSENEGEGEENATSLGIENAEEEDNEEVGGKISNKTQHSENEEGEENATSLIKELELEKAPQNDEDKIAIWEKERILQLKKMFLNLVRMCDDLSLQLASKKEEIKYYQAVHIPPSKSIEKWVRMILDLVFNEKVVRLDDEGFGLIKNMFHAFLKAAIEKVVEFYAFQLNTIDNLLGELSNLVNEKTNVLNERDSFMDEVYGFINEKEKLENEKYDCSKLLIPESSPDRKTKKRSFGDITTSGNDSPERRTRSHLLFKEEEEIPNTAGHMENEEGKNEGGENVT